MPRPATYSYLVKIINPNKKSEYVTRMWHHMHNCFDSPAILRMKLMDAFPEQVPSTPDFKIGYFERKGNAKRWIEEPEDLRAMYASSKGEEITLWCDARQQDKGRKRKATENDTGRASKRAAREDEIDEIYDQLCEKHKENISQPLLKLWARLIHKGQHDDFDTPPKMPIFCRAQSDRKGSKQKKNDLTEAITDAAGAVVKYLSNGTPQGSPNAKASSTPVKEVDDTTSSAGISPAKKAKLCQQYLDQLRTLQQLLEAGVLTQQEFTEQKMYALNNLRKLNS